MKFVHFLCFVLVSMLLWTAFPGTGAAAGQRDQDGYVLGGYGDNDPNIFRPSAMGGKTVRAKGGKAAQAKAARAKGSKSADKAN
jgi:hypothetical protein